MLIPHHIDPIPSVFFGSKSLSLYPLTFIPRQPPLPTSVRKTSFQSFMCFMLTSTSCLQPRTKIRSRIFVKSNATPMAVHGLIQGIDQVVCLYGIRSDSYRRHSCKKNGFYVLLREMHSAWVSRPVYVRGIQQQGLQC